MATPPFDSVASDLVEEVISQAKDLLQAQLTVAIAADQRAMTFAGLLLAGIAVLIGTADRTSGISQVPELVVLTIGFAIAAALACWSARPVPWHLGGDYPSSWKGDVEAKLSLHQTRAESAANFESMLRENEASIQSAALYMRMSMLVALASAIGGIVIAFVA
jgi:hypothetical protein